MRDLGSTHGKLYPLRFRRRVARATLADANESRDWRIDADFAPVLLGRARPLSAPHPIGVDREQSWYARDSTPIDLGRSLFPWARFRQHQSAVTMHPLRDLHGNLPPLIRIPEGPGHDVNIRDEMLPAAGACYVLDRGSLDCERRLVFPLGSAFLVVRVGPSLASV